jgi:hypothetical protein
VLRHDPIGVERDYFERAFWEEIKAGTRKFGDFDPEFKPASTREAVRAAAAAANPPNATAIPVDQHGVPLASPDGQISDDTLYVDEEQDEGAFLDKADDLFDDLDKTEDGSRQNDDFITVEEVATAPPNGTPRAIRPRAG